LRFWAKGSCAWGANSVRIAQHRTITQCSFTSCHCVLSRSPLYRSFV